MKNSGKNPEFLKRTKNSKIPELYISSELQSNHTLGDWN